MHDFRHSHVSLLISNGVPITVIAKRIGYSDIEMTLNTYSHLLLGDEDKAIDVLDTLK
ncbi:MAG: tyrosine-type recombinase/integrase [Bacilli bacterium]|nr:tyrosine-type recombinase/integrase [Bacilli bacterium]